MTATVPLSRCETWATEGFDPFGPITRVRCPDKDHCLQLAPLVEGRIGEHKMNNHKRCQWIGVLVIDDRNQMPCARLYSGRGITTLLRPGAATPGNVRNRRVSHGLGR